MSPKEEATYINHEIEEFQKSSSNAAGQANETLRTLSGQLVVISGTIITLSAAFLSTDHTTSILGHHSRGLLVASWIALAISIVAGVASLYLDSNFFVAWQKYHFNLAKELGTGKYTSKNIGDIYKKHKHPRDRSYLFPLYLQFFFMGVGGLLFLVLIIHIELSK